MARFLLHHKQRAALEQFIRHNPDGHAVVRAYALLWRDEGVFVEEVARRLHTSPRSVFNWTRRFAQRRGWPLARRLADAARSGRPVSARGLIDPLLDAVIDQDPRQWGFRATVWMAALLVNYLRQEHHLTVSTDSVSRALTRLRIRWKRPRHVLARQSPTWRQAKGGLKRGCGAGFAPS